MTVPEFVGLNVLQSRAISTSRLPGLTAVVEGSGRPTLTINRELAWAQLEGCSNELKRTFIRLVNSGVIR